MLNYRNRGFSLCELIGNAHKESCHKLSLILVREQGLIKTDCSGEMVVAFTIKNKTM